jgi:hypothetical protein
MSEETIGILVCAGLGILLLGLGVRTLVERFGSRPVEVLACRRCGSRAVRQLQTDGVAQNPGYRCTECELRMRPAGSTFLYVVVLTVSVVLFSFFTFVLWKSGEGLVAFPFMLIVAGYSVRQLLRPTPVRCPLDQESAGSGGGRADECEPRATPDRPWKRSRPNS